MSFSWPDFRPVLALAGIIFFLMQMLLCVKFPKSRARFVPVLLLAVCLILIILLYCGVFWYDEDGTYFRGNELLAILLGLAWTAPAAGDALAWILVGIRKLYQHLSRGRDEEESSETLPDA